MSMLFLGRLLVCVSCVRADFEKVRQEKCHHDIARRRGLSERFFKMEISVEMKNIPDV